MLDQTRNQRRASVQQEPARRPGIQHEGVPGSAEGRYEISQGSLQEAPRGGRWPLQRPAQTDAGGEEERAPTATKDERGRSPGQAENESSPEQSGVPAESDAGQTRLREGAAAAGMVG